MKLKGLHFVDVAEIQEAVIDELKKFQKEEFSAAFQKVYDHAKVCIYANGAYFELKKLCLPHVSSIFKKISPETFGPHCVSLISDKERKLWKLQFKPLSLLNFNSNYSVCIQTYFL
jgi:hypothetical protein